MLCKLCCQAGCIIRPGTDRCCRRHWEDVEGLGGSAGSLVITHIYCINSRLGPGRPRHTEFNILTLVGREGGERLWGIGTEEESCRGLHCPCYSTMDRSPESLVRGDRPFQRACVENFSSLFSLVGVKRNMLAAEMGLCDSLNQLWPECVRFKRHRVY